MLCDILRERLKGHSLVRTSFTETPLSVAAVPLFNKLHWLPVTFRSDCRIAALAYLRFDSTRTYSSFTIQLLSAQTVLMILHFCTYSLWMFFKWSKKDKNVFVIHQNVQKWMDGLLNSRTDFKMKMERNIRTHITVNYTNTRENWADSFYHSGNTGKSHNPYVWHLFSTLYVSLCNTKK